MIYHQIRWLPFRFLLYLTLSLACAPYGICQRTPLQENLDEAFITAVQRRDSDKIQQLLDSGANINARSSINRYYALQYAVYWSDPNLVKLLLDKGADINLTDDGDRTALMEAANKNEPQNEVIVKLLLDRGADVQAGGNRALLNAAKEGGPEVVQLLLKKGADPNARNIGQHAGDWAGDTALMYAVQGDFVEGVRLLLAAGADVRAVNESGQTVLMKAATVDAGNEVKTHVVMLELLLKRGVDVNARDKNGKTALMHAAYEWFTEAGGVFSHSEILRVLIEHGADVNSQDSQGNTALMTAIRYCRITPAKAGNLEVVKILLEKGAQVNLENRNGQTAMTYAKELSVGHPDADQIRSSIIALLKKAGATALRAELLYRVKQADELRERLLKCTAEKFLECDVPMDRLKRTFDDNAVRLKAIVKQYGWPGNDLVGPDGTSAASLIFMNAEIALKKEMWPAVEDAYHTGKTSGPDYAVLLDDIRVSEGKSQVYGTHHKEGGGVYPIEDEANVDKRRVEVGLPPLAEGLEKQRRNKAPQKDDKR